MSRDPNRKGYYSRDPRNRERDWERPDYRSRPAPRKSRSPARSDMDKRRSRSPRKPDKELLEDNILSEISKLPEPSELWDSQFQDGGFSGPPPPPTFQTEGVSSSYGSNYQPSYSGIYDDFPAVGSVPTAPLPPEISAWNQMSLPPPPTAPPAPFMTTPEDQMKKEAAIESEMRHQKAALSKQREDYIKKAAILKKELDTLKDQRSELRGDTKRSPSPDTKRFLKENTKLQLEIQNKLKTINNVVDMLNGIIGEEAQDLHHDSDESTERGSKHKSRSPSAGRKFNYVYYDPEMHWCRVCNEFPSTAKDYLNHLHSPAHHKMAAAHMEAPWHSVAGANDGFPSVPAAPAKRTPIRGLQFFVPSTAWYCKLCDQFIGDLHCASAHLKSIVHSKNYTNFVEQNPHWETDWMSDRQKAFEKARASNKGIKPQQADEKPQYAAHTITFNKDGFHTKRKNSPTPALEEKKKKKDKKKKGKRKRSSSSSSSSNSSSSDSEPVKKKKKKREKARVGPDDKTLTEWMSAIQADRLNDNDRKLLDSLKIRIKHDKMEEEKRRSPERSADVRKERESERREARAHDRREGGREGGRRDRREDRRDERARSPPRSDTKKPEIRKMPFIGKMPVYKNLGKTKSEEQKKDEQKKKDEDEAMKKRREEMDAEIQKKVAEFKEKIAKAQLERAVQGDLPPPAIALPTTLGGSVPAYLPPPSSAAPAHAAPPPPLVQAPPPAQTPNTSQPPPTLPKDFQDALDIIFPSDVKPDLSQSDLFAGMGMPPPGFPMGLGGVMPSFPPFLQPQMPPQVMMSFEMNTSLFSPRPQLYDTHVPIVPGQKQRQQNKNRQNQNKNNQNKNRNQGRNNQQMNKSAAAVRELKENGEAAKKREELDDLAMLGIDASDVGAGI